MKNHVFIISPFVSYWDPVSPEPRYSGHPLVSHHVDTVFSFLSIANELCDASKIHLLAGKFATRGNILKQLAYDIPYYAKQNDNVFVFVSSDGYVVHEQMMEENGRMKWRQFVVDEAVVPPLMEGPITRDNVRSIRTTTYTYMRDKFDRGNKSRTIYKGNPRTCRYGVRLIDNIFKGSEIYDILLGDNPIRTEERYIPIYDQNGESSTWNFTTKVFNFRGVETEVIFSDLTDNPCMLVLDEDYSESGRFTSYLPPSATYRGNMPETSMFATYSHKGLLDDEYNVFSSDDLALLLTQYPCNFFMLNAFDHAGGFGPEINAQAQSLDTAVYIMNLSSVYGKVHYLGQGGCIGVDAFELALLNEISTFDTVASKVKSDMGITNNISDLYQSCEIHDIRRGIGLYSVPYVGKNLI